MEELALVPPQEQAMMGSGLWKDTQYSACVFAGAPSGAFPLLPSATGGRSVVAAPTDALPPGHKAAAVSPADTWSPCNCHAGMPGTGTFYNI